MSLPLLLMLSLFGAAAAWASGWLGPRWPRVISLLVLATQGALVFALWLQHRGVVELGGGGPWLVVFDQPWIPSLNIRFSLALDGISLLLIALSVFLTFLAVATSWASIQERVGFFHFNLLLIMGALTGIFLATDLFLFYVFWEVLLVPLFFLIALWGHERRRYAAIKFFIYTQASGLLLLLAILGLHFTHARATGVHTFSYFELLGSPLPPSTGLWLMLGFFVAFAVKLPVVPLHTWLPDAHTEAPTAGSVELAGLVLKVGAYGLLRFTLPLFPEASREFAPAAMALGVVGILYGAVVAVGQRDLKRLVAYTSVSHMGFVLLGVFSANELALQGAVTVMLAHGISTSALFILVGNLDSRMHTRDLGRMGGLWATAPKLGGATLLFSLASLGLPGLGNFVGEFMVLLGAFQVNAPLAVLATLGFIASTVYSLWIIQYAFHGPNQGGWKLSDLNAREGAIVAALTAVIVGLGLYPQPEIDTARRSVEDISRRAAAAPTARAEP